jgi:hypothetical protein
VTTVPYADGEQRRKYHRKYQRALRWGLMDDYRKISLFVCLRSPNARLGPGINFEGGFLATDSRRVKAAIESHANFGKTIFKVRLDWSLEATEDEEGEGE